ncbi:TPA: hypothetical protein ACGB8P_000391 [Listeria monocytogenes]
MEFEECVNRLYELSHVSEEEIANYFRLLANEVSKNGITGLVPLDEGGISDGVPFFHILTTLRRGLEESTIHDERLLIESLYSDLQSEGIDGFTSS